MTSVMKYESGDASGNMNHNYVYIKEKKTDCNLQNKKSFKKNLFSSMLYFFFF